MPSNANNAAVALPVEILHIIFIFCTGHPDDVLAAAAAGPDSDPPVFVNPRYPPSWIAISYVCQRWRAVALDFRKLWSTITLDLSPKWISACLKRSAYAPKRVDVEVGPPPTPPPSKKRRRRHGGASMAKKRRVSRKVEPEPEPLMALPGLVVKKVFSHAERIESVHLEGDTEDVIRTLRSLGGSMPLSSLSLNMWDASEYSHFGPGDAEERVDPSLVLSDALFGGSAPRLRRLHVHSGLHVTFPSWLLRGVTEFTVSCSFCAKRLFSALGQMPQLEVLRLAPARRYMSLPYGITMPIALNHLSLLVIEDKYLELLIALLERLSLSADVRMHLKLRLDQSMPDTYLFDRFALLMRDIIADFPVPLHGIRFRREPLHTSVRLWVSPTDAAAAAASANDVPSSLASCPPLDDPFSLEIYCKDRNCLYGRHSSQGYTVSYFHRLQDLCVSLGGPDVQELFVEYGFEPNSRRPPILYCCWQTLFAGLPSLKTLRFGDGAAELLVSALYGGAAPAALLTSTIADTRTPSNAAAANGVDDGETETETAGCGFLSGSLRRVTVSRGAFSTRILWNWIHYAFARPAEWDASMLRMNVLADLSVPRWKPADVDAREDVTESLLIFLLHCRSLGAQVELSLVESTWDEPGGLEILRRLLRILDPEWNVILETTSPA